MFFEFFMIDEKDFELRLGRQAPLLEQTKYGLRKLRQRKNFVFRKEKVVH